MRQGNATTEEIDVEGNKSLMTLEGDKKVFNASQMISTKGGTALDVLKKVPLVDVDINDNVSLRGSQNVKILIDDKPSHYASLKQVPSDAIEKVEIITNPPAKYEAEGVTGIINIVMKKSNLLGFTGDANAGGSYVNRFRGWGGVDLNLKKNTWTVYSSIYAGLFNYSFNYNSLTSYYQPISSLTNIGSGTGNSNYFWGQGGVEKEFSIGKTLGFQGSYNYGTWGNIDNSHHDNFDNTGTVSSSYNENSNRVGLWESINGNMYLNMKLGDKGRELNTSIDFTRNRNTNDFYQVDHNFNVYGIEVIAPRDQRDSTQLKSYNLNTQIDYTDPVSQTSKIEAGYKGTVRINDNNFLSDTADFYHGTNFNNDMSVTNRFKLSEYINAAYGVFSSAIGKNFTYKLGVRLEQTNSTGDLITTGSSIKKSYLDIFPSVSLSEKLGSSGHMLQLSYSRRITRPSIWRLNPFVNKHDARFWSQGNPNLNPEYTNSYELSVMLFSKYVTFTPLVFYRRSTGIISAYSYLVNNDVALTTYRNAVGSNAYGTDIIINSSALSWVNLNGTFSFYNTKFDQEAVTDYNAEAGFSWKANVRSTFTFGKLFNIELFYQYTGKKINAQGINEPQSNFDVGVSRNMLDDKLTVSLRASDIFNTNKYGSETDAATYKSTFHNNWDSRLWFLNISYRFGNTDQQFQKKNNTKRNSNENNDSQDSNGK